MIGHVRDLFAWTEGANHAVLDAAAALTPEELSRELGGSFPSVRATLAHMMGAEWIWLRRWHGTSPVALPGGWSLDDVGSIRARWSEVERERVRFLDGLEGEDLERVLEYRDMKGTAYETPLGELLLHVTHHAAYHRGQVINFLRMLGQAPPRTDLVLFYRERRRPVEG
ncbi:MAG: DinB family protein [Gemmatimonadetes bacterium]|nr:DinB family protein [Gemmatimonadota bacterium]